MMLDIFLSGNDVNCDDLTNSHTRIAYFSQLVVDATTPFAIKLTLSIMFLIVIRGCVPRYRYDLLTKMGWIKFLGYILMILLLAITLFLLW